MNSPFEGVYTWLWAAFLGGLLIAMPVVAWQLWAFIAPGLYKSERRLVYPLTFASSALFAGGAAFCFFVLLPIAMPFFMTVIPNMATSLSIRGYLGGVVTMMIAACFQLPVVIWFLAKLGLVDHKDLISGFRYAMVGIFIIAAFITPPDPLTQTALAIPTARPALPPECEQPPQRLHAPNAAPPPAPRRASEYPRRTRSTQRRALHPESARSVGHRPHRADQRRSAPQS